MEKSFSCFGKIIKIDIRDEVDASVANEIFKWREYRAAEARLAAASDPIVDVGAHAGFFTLYARALNPAVPIIALEPEPDNLAQAAKNLARNQAGGVSLLPLALAGANGRRKLALSGDSHNHRLVRDKERLAPAERGLIVSAITLPGLMARYKITAVSLLKCDIEGGEYEVFAGLRPEDYKKIKAVIMEYHTWPGRPYKIIENSLRENGFGVQIFPSRFDKRLGFLWAVNKQLKNNETIK